MCFSMVITQGLRSMMVSFTFRVVDFTTLRALTPASVNPRSNSRLISTRSKITSRTRSGRTRINAKALIALLIRLTSPGPAIFRQERCGLNGRRFTFYKFRSMCQDAEAMRASLEHLSQRELALKIPNDPRLTAVGRWLRKFSIDEWPQLWNV
ncbi:MAG: sugar transferase, partial [Verrucomicrobia bacterium]|nr:sugar transferase [Verrucomicrobiota bacterium]